MERFTLQSEKSPEKNNGAREEAISRISRVLEECEKNNEGIHILEEALNASSKALSTLYDRVAKKYKTIIGALLFATIAQTSEARQLSEDLKIEIIQIEESINTTGNEVVEKNTGINFIKEAEKIGRNATFYISENESAPTIGLIGQTHALSQEVNYKYYDDIVKSQTEIGSFLVNTTTSEMTVFIEGYAPEDEASLKAVKEDSARIATTQNFVEFEKEYRKIYFSDNNGYKTNRAILNKVAGDKLISLGFKETAPMVYHDGHNTFALYTTGFFLEGQSYTVSNEVESSMAGAPRILYAEGQINIQPAETIESSSKSFVLRDKLREKGVVLGKLFASFDSNNTYYQYLQKENLPNIADYSTESLKRLAEDESCKKSVECQKIISEIIHEDIPAIKKAVMDDREDIAIELIAKYAKTSDQTYFPLVYGNLHDFIRAIKKWNAEHPEQQFNLVTIK